MSILQGLLAQPNQSTFVLMAKIFLGIALLIGAPFLGIGLLDRFDKAHGSDHWTEGVATITQSKVENANVGGKPGFAPRIVYTFEIRGRAWYGNMISFSKSNSRNRADVEELTQKYAVGTQHPVFYNPAEPSDCVLEKGAGWVHYLGLLVPLAFFFGGGWIVWDNGRAFWHRLNGAATA